MEKLLQVLREHYPVETVQEIEEHDPMYQALIGLHRNLKNKEIFIPLVITNALICYQLSSNGESYWEEFGREASVYEFSTLQDIYLFWV
jgi:N-glycosylase/DNA lyase